MTNKTLLGVFVLVFIIVGIVWFVRKNPDALKQLKLPFNVQQAKVTPTPTGTAVSPQLPVATGTNPIPTVSVPMPNQLISCTSAVSSQQCNTLPVQTVCGFDQTTFADGRIEVHSLPYNTACHYCRIFGDSSNLSMGDVKIKALGYQNNACK